MKEMYGIRIPLPSRGKYGKTHMNVARPKVGTITEYLQSENSLLAKNMFTQQHCEDDIYDLPVGDREFLFANLRSLINSTVITGTLPCTREKCGSSVAYMLDLKTCVINQLPDDFESNYMVELPVSKDKMTLNMLTVRREELVDAFLQFYASADGKLLHSDLGENLPEFARYASMTYDVKNIGDIEKQITYLRALDWSDFEVVILYDVSFECGPVITAKAICDDCGQRYKISIKTDSTFFGLSLQGLIGKHTFLARNTHISFADFCNYTVPILNAVAEDEVIRIRDFNSKVRRK